MTALPGRRAQLYDKLVPGKPVLSLCGTITNGMAQASPLYPTEVEVVKTPDYRERYANSVQIRVNLWDFFLVFGTLDPNATDKVRVEVFQGIYLSPQQAKALANLLEHNVAQYEATFGEIRLEPIAREMPVQ